MKLSNRFWKLYNQAFGTIISIAGFVLLVIYGNWKIALGILFVVWANNIGMSEKYKRGAK